MEVVSENHKLAAIVADLGVNPSESPTHPSSNIPTKLNLLGRYPNSESIPRFAR